MEYLDETLTKFWDLNTEEEFNDFDIQFKNTLKKILLYLGNYNYNFSKKYIDGLLNIIKTFLQISENNFNKVISLSSSLHSNQTDLDIHLKRKKLCRKFNKYIEEMSDTIERNYSIFGNIPHDLENNILSYLPIIDLDRLSKMNLYLKNQVMSIKSKRRDNQLPPIGITTPRGRTMPFNIRHRHRIRTDNRQVQRIFITYPIILDALYDVGFREIRAGIETETFLHVFNRSSLIRINNSLRRNTHHPRHIRMFIGMLIRMFCHTLEQRTGNNYMININMHVLY